MPLPLLHRLPRGDRRALARFGTPLTALALAALSAAAPAHAQIPPAAPSTGAATPAGAAPAVAPTPLPW